jgi:hypothetical protein
MLLATILTMFYEIKLKGVATYCRGGYLLIGDFAMIAPKPNPLVRNEGLLR